MHAIEWTPRVVNYFVPAHMLAQITDGLRFGIEFCHSKINIYLGSRQIPIKKR